MFGDSSTDSSMANDDNQDGTSGGGQNAETEDGFKVRKKIDDFDGDPDKARKWINSFMFDADLNGWTDEVKAKRFPIFLKESALNWYKISVNDSTFKNDIHEIKKKFEAVFLPFSSQTMIAKELDAKRMKEHEAVNRFIVDTRYLCKEYNPDMDEKEIVDKIVARLHPSFFPFILHKDPQDLDSLHRDCALIQEGHRGPNEHNSKTNAIFSKGYKPSNNKANCTNCHKNGHTWDVCRAPRRSNYSNNHNRNNQPNYGPRANNYQGQSRNNYHSNARSNYQGNPRNSYNNHNQSNYQNSYQNSNNIHHGNRQNNQSWNRNNRANFNNLRNQPDARGSSYNNNNSHANTNHTDNTQRQNNIANSNNRMLAYIAPEKPFLRKIFINNQPVNALIDTGASASFIKLDKANQLKLTLIPTTLTMGVANGTSMGELKETKAKITINTLNQQHNFDHELTVASNLPFDAIVGKDIIRERETSSSVEQTTR